MLEACRVCKKAILARTVLYCIDCNAAIHTDCLPTPPEHDPLYFTTPPPWRCRPCATVHINTATTGTGKNPMCTCRKCGKTRVRPMEDRGYGFGVGWACSKECAGCRWCGREHRASDHSIACRPCVKRNKSKPWKAIRNEPFVGAGQVAKRGVWFWWSDKAGKEWRRVCFDWRGDGTLWCADYRSTEFRMVKVFSKEQLFARFKSHFSKTLYNWKPIIQKILKNASINIDINIDDQHDQRDQSPYQPITDENQHNIDNQTIKDDETLLGHPEPVRPTDEYKCWKLQYHNNNHHKKNTFKTKTPPLRSHDHPNVYVSRSTVAGLGLFAARRLSPHDPIIPYSGEIVSKPLADHRERLYTAHPLHRTACYLFSLDDSDSGSGSDRIIDATLCGNHARFINHSCQPNCDARVVSGCIWIVARRRVECGEELFYDYKFSASEHGDDDRVECRCGARRCRKYI